MRKLYRGPETPKEKLYQREAGASIGISQPAISTALRSGKLKSLAPEDVAAYKQSRHYRELYFKRKEEREDRMHEEHMKELQSLNGSIRMVTVAIAALGVKGLVK